MMERIWRWVARQEKKSFQRWLDQPIAFPLKALEALKRGEMPDLNKEFDAALTENIMYAIEKPRIIFGLILGVGLKHPELRGEIMKQLELFKGK